MFRVSLFNSEMYNIGRRIWIGTINSISSSNNIFVSNNFYSTLQLSSIKSKNNQISIQVFNSINCNRKYSTDKPDSNEIIKPANEKENKIDRDVESVIDEELQKLSKTDHNHQRSTSEVKKWKQKFEFFFFFFDPFCCRK
jgi:hypothetical protein